MYKLLFLLFGFQFVSAQAPIAQAHAHNDYAKLRPAFRAALAQGCTSIEIDVYPSGKQGLRVSHIPLFLFAKPRFEKQYLAPLAQYIQERGGTVFPDAPEQPLVLMIDIKRDGSEAYKRLRQLAQKYEHLLTVYYPELDSLRPGPLLLLLSGSKPYKEVLSDSVCYMFLDGTLGDMQRNEISPVLMPRISASYRGQFSWRGRGEMPEEELQKLRAYCAQAKAQKRKLRFWAMPNREAVWKLFLDEGIGYLNIDKIKAFAKFYRSSTSEGSQ